MSARRGHRHKHESVGRHNVYPCLDGVCGPRVLTQKRARGRRQWVGARWRAPRARAGSYVTTRPSRRCASLVRALGAGRGARREAEVGAGHLCSPSLIREMCECPRASRCWGSTEQIELCRNALSRDFCETAPLRPLEETRGAAPACLPSPMDAVPGRLSRIHCTLAKRLSYCRMYLVQI